MNSEHETNVGVDAEFGAEAEPDTEAAEAEAEAEVEAEAKAETIVKAKDDKALGGDEVREIRRRIDELTDAMKADSRCNLACNYLCEARAVLPPCHE